MHSNIDNEGNVFIFLTRISLVLMGVSVSKKEKEKRVKIWLKNEGYSTLI